MAFHSVIMAGGSGTRFWPLSRAGKPKQLLAITGEHSMVRATSERVAPVTPLSHQWVVCGARHEAAVKTQLPQLPVDHVLVEPLGRNTAPAIGLACIHALTQDRDAVLCVLPADAHVSDAAAFGAHMRAAQQVALRGPITTLGLRPHKPETGYGYIKMGPNQETALGLPVHTVDRFVEKPNAATAQEYLAQGTYLWNAGIFVFQAAVMMDALAKHLPPLHAGLGKIAAAVGTPAYAQVLKDVWPTLPSVSIDYGVMEKIAGQLAVIPSTFPWSDVGSFAALPEVLPLDPAGNVVLGNAVLQDVTHSVVDSRAGRMVAVLGVTGMVVVDAGDAVLVLPKDRAQDVGKLLELLKARGQEDLL